MVTTYRLLSRGQVCDLTSLSKTEIDRREARGEFPKRVRLSKHPRGRCAYVETEVMRYLEALVAERDRETP